MCWGPEWEVEEEKQGVEAEAQKERKETDRKSFFFLLVSVSHMVCMSRPEGSSHARLKKKRTKQHKGDVKLAAACTQVFDEIAACLHLVLDAPLHCLRVCV